VKEEELIK
jgi:hypothetical protein